MKNVALITGASSGIGLELARIHAKKGNDLVIVSRKLSDLEKVKKEFENKYKIKVVCIAKDLSQPTSAKELYDEIKSQKIEVEYLINNAGFGGQGYFHEREWEKDLAMIQVNIVTLTELTRLFLPEFVARNHGRILNTSSTASFMPGPMQAVYYATKAYVTFFSNAIASELEGTGVTVTSLMPGATETKFGATSGMDKTELFKKTVSPKVVAKDGYEGMMKGKIDVISGVPTMLRATLAISPMMPKKMLLNTIKQQQQVK
ncbi:MAG: short-chain dehydrogenase [Epulopiscium sp. Nele67-Bin004]|nr:MAG: short-chain dehydrogenase [Epulopiscium sp. Nele67-Bin004]